jgi:hypothetical protein
MTIHQLSKALPQSMESVARAALLSHFSDIEKELQHAHDNNTQLHGDLMQLRNRLDTLQAQTDGLKEFFSDALDTRMQDISARLDDLWNVVDQLARILSEVRAPSDTALFPITPENNLSLHEHLGASFPRTP